MTRLFCLFLLVIGNCAVYAQSDLATAKNELILINNQLDSLEYVTFNMNVAYNSDTLFGHFDADVLPTTYVLNRQNIYYSAGPIEYMQNDSFNTTVYNDEHMMMVSRKPIVTSSLFPLRDFVNQTLNNYDSLYQITIGLDADSNKVIEFRSDSLNAPFNRMSIHYDAEYLLSKIEMNYLQATSANDLQHSIYENNSSTDSSNIGDPDLDSLDIVRPVMKKMVMTFNNYQFIQNGKVFNDAAYFYFDRIRNGYCSTGKYKGYRLLSSNLGNIENEEGIEKPVPEQ